MNKQTIPQRLDAIEKEQAELRKLLEQPEQPKVTAQPLLVEPEFGQKYWYKMSTGECCRDTWDNHFDDNRRFLAGNTFATEADAKRSVRLDQLRFMALQAMNKAWKDVGKVIDWEDDTRKCHAPINHVSNEIDYDWNFAIQKSPYVFPSMQSCKAFYESLSFDDACLLISGV